MDGENTTTPSTPVPKVRSGVRLRKLGHATAPRAATAKTIDPQQRLPLVGSPIAFPVDSPILSEQPSMHTKAPGRRRKNIAASFDRSESITSITNREDVVIVTQTGRHWSAEELSRYNDEIPQDPGALAAGDQAIDVFPGEETSAPVSRNLLTADLSQSCFQPLPGHGSSQGGSPTGMLCQPSSDNPPTNRKSAPKPPSASHNVNGTSQRRARKEFEMVKHDKAAAFLKELDDTITGGKLAELAASTGGVKLNWTNKLNTTAGRANWKRESIRTGPAAVTEAQYRHHASIDIAEKVIDNENRLLNVIAHEFCHLANFMISGITKNPHGREFKSWAARCSRAFGERGIEVTTKHSYDIDFKYIWSCTSCKVEYKRHSKSIDPGRHRCGSCGELLEQTKPSPRAKGSRKASAYQIFVGEQMRFVRAQNPNLPQKEIMRLVAEKWAASPQKARVTKPEVKYKTSGVLQDLTSQLEALELEINVDA